MPIQIVAMSITKRYFTSLFSMPPFGGHYLYYPGHRLVPAGLRAFVDVLKDVERDARPTARPRQAASAAHRPAERPGN
ncbi:hypothetical protein BOSP111201_23320 [Bordetella sputigena]